MDSLFVYIWKHSRREQIVILLIVLASLPLYFISLDLPKHIVNDAIQGKAFAGGHETATAFQFTLPTPSWLGGPVTLFDGFALTQLPYLFAMCGLFLFLVLVNGAFKFVINLRKGALGERLLQRLRLDLFNSLLSFSPEAARHVKPSEVATIIKDEIEPVGGFVSEAFVQPVFLGGQALTALMFIILQNAPLGLCAGAVVLVQAVVIPRLRREQLRLGKERQIKSRALAGRIGEAAVGLSEINNHGATAYERERVATRLDELFKIRYDLFRRKFSVKFLNNLMAQVTPFIFYSIGGYYVLTGQLDIGQLVAVIAAYRELPPPIKELIDWDQQRLDVEVKYKQVMEQFTPAMQAAPVEEQTHPPGRLQGVIECRSLTVRGNTGEALLENANLSIPLGKHVALLSSSGDAGGALAQTLGRRITQYDGEILVADMDLARIAKGELGARVAYCGPEPIIFDTSIRANIRYGMTGLLALDGVALDEETLDRRIRAQAQAIGMDEDIYAFAIGRRFDVNTPDAVLARALNARHAMRIALIVRPGPPLVEPFDPESYNHHSTVLENLLFGATTVENAANDETVFTIIRQAGLTEPLQRMGRTIAATVVEIFADLDADNFLFQRFSFLTLQQLASYREILMRAELPGATLGAEDQRDLISLAFRYVEPEHRLALLTPDIEQRIVGARSTVAKRASELSFPFEQYNPQRLCRLANIRDNLLFGRIAREVPGAEAAVMAVLRSVCENTNIAAEIFRLGLDHQAGQRGCMLLPAQRLAVSLARCLIKEPDVLILDEALSTMQESSLAILAKVRRLMEGRTLIFVTRDGELANSFDMTIRFGGSRVRRAANDADPDRSARRGAVGNAELAALGALPIFSALDVTHLKLLAFTSERLLFQPGDALMRQGEPADSAYVIIEGEAEVVWNRGDVDARLNVVGKDALVGEIGLVIGAPRTASVIALKETRALRIRADVLFGLISEFPQISLAIMRDQIRRIGEMQERLVVERSRVATS